MGQPQSSKTRFCFFKFFLFRLELIGLSSKKLFASPYLSARRRRRGLARVRLCGRYQSRVAYSYAQLHSKGRPKLAAKFHSSSILCIYHVVA
jgi:hypothetical protein